MYYDKSGCMKLIESIEDVYCILKTVSHIDPNYIDKVTDIKLGTTNRGQQKLEFNADNKSVLVIWYPKKKEQLYYCIDNVNQGYANNIFDILDKLFVKSESFNVKLESKNTSYTLKGKINNKDYDIAYDNNFSNLKKLKNELYSCHSHIEMWIEDENRNKKEELAHIHKCEMYNMKELKEAYDIWDNSSKTIETNLKVTDKNEFGNKLKENYNKLEEVSRNELLVKAKSQTITRYNKAAGYRGFNIVDIDTTGVLVNDALRITCRVGDYFDTVELQNILYWVETYAERNKDRQINTKTVTKALMDAIDAMDIKVDCSCSDWRYRFAFQATKFKYKYGKPENRPAKITNPNDYGSLCKHLISMLGNKRWLQQVTATFMDFIVERIEEINRYLKLKDDKQLTLPNELARRNAKAGYYAKVFDKVDKDEKENEDNNEEQEQQDNVENNEQDEQNVNQQQNNTEEERNNDAT